MSQRQDDGMTVALPQQAKDLLDAANIVTVATVNADGGPQSSLLWATYEGDDLLLSTIKGRAKERNFGREPRVSVLIQDRTDPYTYVEVRGTVTMTTDGGPELIQSLSRSYVGQDFTGDLGTDRIRVVVRVTPTRVFTYSE
jgi:PPOX class probable F420-dependent enzyme